MHHQIPSIRETASGGGVCTIEQLQCELQYLTKVVHVLSTKVSRWESEALEAPLSPVQKKWYQELRVWRLATSKAAKQPAFCVFSNKVLEGIVRKNPATLDELREVRGIGSYKSEKYGAQILVILRACRIRETV